MRVPGSVLERKKYLYIPQFSMTILSQSSVLVDPAGFRGRLEVREYSTTSRPVTMRYFSNEVRGLLGCKVIGLGLRGQGYEVTVIQVRVRLKDRTHLSINILKFGKHKPNYLKLLKRNC